MKRYYTVREASRVLGVSTNTVYKYLKEGKVKGRRIGKGRFKIPRGELSPYIDRKDKREFHRTHSKEGFLADFVSESSTYSSDFKGAVVGKKDFILFRLFVALSLFGLGLIFLFLKSDLFTVSDNRISGGIGTAAFTALAILLIIGGALLMLDSFYFKKLRDFQPHIFIFLLVVLVFWGIATLTSGGYSRSIFALAYISIVINHLIKGVKKHDLASTFYDEFLKFNFLLVLFGGIIVIASPSTFVFGPVGNFVQTNPVVSAFLWFGLVLAGFIYLLSPHGKRTKFYIPFLSLGGLFALVIAVQHTFRADWDIAYLTYLNSGFSFFLVWWQGSKLRVVNSKAHIFVLPFFWIGATLIVGIFLIRTIQFQAKNKAIEQTTSHLNKIVNEVNFFFEQSSAVINYANSGGVLLAAINLRDESAAISSAKKIYDELNKVRRVIVYTKDATAIGVYPRSTIGQGTDFSSREYYRITRDTLRGYITPAFMSVINQPAVLQTEPLFANGQFAGFVGVAMDLEEISLAYQSELGQNQQIHALDENGVLVLDTNIDLIGEKSGSGLFNEQDVYETADVVRVRQHAKLPRWDIFLDIDKEVIYKNVSAVNIAFSVFLVLNSIFSIRVTTALVKKK